MLKTVLVASAHYWHITNPCLQALPRLEFTQHRFGVALQPYRGARFLHTSACRAARRPVVVQAAKKDPNELVKRIGRGAAVEIHLLLPF